VQKKILPAKERRERKCRKRFFPCECARKKSERKCRKRFSLLKSGEKEKEDRKRKEKGRGGSTNWSHHHGEQQPCGQGTH